MSEPKFKVGDKVRILDGSKIPDYRDGWAPFTMGKKVGKVATIERALDANSRHGIGYRLVGYWETWDERGLELVREQPRKILIMQDKADPMQVIARDLDSGKTALAKCSPKDTFDFYTGAKLAFNRLTEPERPAAPEAKPEPKPEAPKCKFKVGDNVIGNAGANFYGITRRGWRGEVVKVVGDHTIWVTGPGVPRPGTPVSPARFDLDTQPKYYTGKVVCVKRSPDCRYWTVGKVYEVKDGKIRDDDGDARRGCKSPEDIAGKCLGSGTFVEFKGGAV